MEKRFFSFLMALCMCVALVPTGTASEPEPPVEIIDSGTCGADNDGSNLIWILSADGILTIIGEGDMADFPEADKVPWFEYREAILDIDIGDGVTSIGKFAFCAFLSLTSVTIPNNILSIGEDAFFYCETLRSVTISDGVLLIDAFAFANCPRLGNVTIPKSTTIIGRGAFMLCSALNSVTILNSAVNIGESAFTDCDALLDIYYSGSATQWDKISATADVSSITTVHCNISGEDEDSPVQTITLSFGDVQWTDSDADLQDYDDLAGQRVLVVPIVASSSDGKPFEVGVCQFDVNFNQNGKVLIYKDIKDEGCGVLSYIVGKRSILPVSTTEEATANKDGNVIVIFSEPNIKSFSVTNNQVIAKMVFWSNDTAKTSETRLSFGEDVHILVYNQNADYGFSEYPVKVSGAVRVPAYETATSTSIVTFDPNGGSGSMSSRKIAEDGEFTLPVCKFTPPSTPPNLEFDGWLVNGTVYQPGDTVKLNSDAVAVAQWYGISVKDILPNWNGAVTVQFSEVVRKPASVVVCAYSNEGRTPPPDGAPVRDGKMLSCAVRTVDSGTTVDLSPDTTGAAYLKAFLLSPDTSAPLCAPFQKDF